MNVKDVYLFISEKFLISLWTTICKNFKNFEASSLVDAGGAALFVFVVGFSVFNLVRVDVALCELVFRVSLIFQTILYNYFVHFCATVKVAVHDSMIVHRVIHSTEGG